MAGGFGWTPRPFDVRVERRDDGSMLITPTATLDAYPVRVTDRLDYWAEHAPERVFVAQRASDDSWYRLTYRQALRQVRGIAASLALRRQAGQLSVERPIVILSGNSVEHLLLSLAAMYVGVPYTPVSTTYSQGNTDLGKLRYILQLLTPGMIAAFAAPACASAIQQTVASDIEVVADVGRLTGRQCTTLTELMNERDHSQLEVAHQAVNADTIVKFLLTSGSTGNPKAVITTHRMLCSNQMTLSQALPFVSEEPPVLVDWLPWNHTFGGSHNVNLVLFNGGSLYIDNGQPMSGGFEQTVKNLKEISPTIYFNVPKGFELLAQRLQQDAELRMHFFSKLRACFFAGAGLSQHTWDALNEQALLACGEPLPMISGLGATECAPSVTLTTPGTQRAGAIGLPAMGNVVKLAPVEGKLEMRAKGPNITPGYWRQPELTRAAFDEEGYYRMGDAVRWINEHDISQGLMFDGRIAEDFKLSSGTWVSVGPLRANLLTTLAPYALDVVITGLNRDDLGILIFPDWHACTAGMGIDLPREQMMQHPLLQAELKKRLSAYNQQHSASSMAIKRAMLLSEPASLELGEITDKGSINQHAVLHHRAQLLEQLYVDAMNPMVITI